MAMGTDKTDILVELRRLESTARFDGATVVSAIENAADEIDRLRAVCAECYQFAGTVGAPARVLDQLHAAAEGRALPHESFLPVSTDDVPGRETIRVRIDDDVAAGLQAERATIGVRIDDVDVSNLKGTPEDDLMRAIFGVGIGESAAPVGKAVALLLRELSTLSEESVDAADPALLGSFRDTARELLARLGEKR